jgi:hypothetical protein
MAKFLFQVHEHWRLDSRLSPTPKIVHSHAGGDQPHQHPHCGPAFYGYGTPMFSAKPKGEQLPWVELENWQRSFEVVYTGTCPPEQRGYEGGGLLAAERMVRGFKMRAIVVDARARFSIFDGPAYRAAIAKAGGRS